MLVERGSPCGISPMRHLPRKRSPPWSARWSLAVASLPEPVSSAHVQLIAELILRAAKEGERDPATLDGWRFWSCRSGRADECGNASAAGIRAVREESRRRTRSVRSTVQTTGLLNHCINEIPIRQESLFVIGSTASASTTSSVVKSEASALRLTELKSVPAEIVAMTESPCTGGRLMPRRRRKNNSNFARAMLIQNLSRELSCAQMR